MSIKKPLYLSNTRAIKLTDHWAGVLRFHRGVIPPFGRNPKTQVIKKYLSPFLFEFQSQGLLSLFIPVLQNQIFLLCWNYIDISNCRIQVRLCGRNSQFLRTGIFQHNLCPASFQYHSHRKSSPAPPPVQRGLDCP